MNDPRPHPDRARPHARITLSQRPKRSSACDQVRPVQSERATMGAASTRRPPARSRRASSMSSSMIHCASLVHDDLPCIRQCFDASRSARGARRVRRAAGGARGRRAHRRCVRDRRARRGGRAGAARAARRGHRARRRVPARRHRGAGVGERAAHPRDHVPPREDGGAVRGRGRRGRGRGGRRSDRVAHLRRAHRRGWSCLFPDGRRVRRAVATSASPVAQGSAPAWARRPRPPTDP